MLDNALDHLRARHVTYGFAFLRAESSVPVSETMPLPVPDPAAMRGGMGLLVAAAGLLLVSRAGSWFGSSWRPPRSVSRLAIALVVLAPVVGWVSGNVVFATYQPPSSYALALATALANTVKVAAAAIVLSLVLGLIVGLSRLSRNPLLSRIALAYVELMRNVPLLLHVFFWYFGVFQALPAVRGSLHLGDLLFVNNRGLILAEPTPSPASPAWLAIVALAGLATAALLRAARARRVRTGRSVPVALPFFGIVAAGCVLGSLAGAPLHLDRPQLRGFNFVGGLSLTPEYGALLVALALYHAAFVAEILRSAIVAVHRAQTEAGLSLGLSPRQVLWLVVLPQAQRIAIPALLATSLGLIKDTSLGVTIGYPELVEVSGTVLEASGQVLEVIAIVVGFYMLLTLSFSALVNRYHARLRLPGA